MHVERSELATNGFAIASRLITEERRLSLVRCFEEGSIELGHRGGLGLAPVRELALELLRAPSIVDIVGEGAAAVRAILFDKSPKANWPVAFHQDTTIPVLGRGETPGFGAWSVKDGVVNVRPPAWVLESMLTVRVDLDGSDAGNGALHVIPGSHGRGILERAEIEDILAKEAGSICEVPACGALLMRPLLLHGSRRRSKAGHRRVVHVEIATQALPGDLEWHAKTALRASL